MITQSVWRGPTWIEDRFIESMLVKPFFVDVSIPNIEFFSPVLVGLGFFFQSFDEDLSAALDYFAFAVKDFSIFANFQTAVEEGILK